MQWYYKNGEVKLFEEGEDPEGWTDSPDKEAPKAEKPVVKKVARKKRTVKAK